MIHLMRSLVVPSGLLFVLSVPSCSEASDSAKTSNDLVPITDINATPDAPSRKGGTVWDHPVDAAVDPMSEMRGSFRA